MKTLLKLLAFGGCFLLLLILCDFFLIRTDVVTCAIAREMEQRDDIELAVVGSSVVRDHFNAELITEQTGLNAFSVAVPGAGLQGFSAITEELYKTNHPKLLALVLEPYNFNNAREAIQAHYFLFPWLTGLRTRLTYYWQNASMDGYWIDRALLFREFTVQSFADFVKTLRLRLDPGHALPEYLANLGDGVTYRGAGFLRNDVTPDLTDKIRREMIAERDDGYDYPLLPESREMLLAYRDQVEAMGTEFFVVISDNLNAHALAEPDYLRYMQNLMDFCTENGIACYNFFYATSDFLPDLDDSFYDLYHMNGTGADIQSAAFSRLVNALRNGEDVSSWFYEKAWQYKETIRRIVNCWVLPARDGFKAGCNTGSMVTPEYRFVLRDAEGHETPLRDYDTNPRLAYELSEGMTLRVYARLQEEPDQEPAWFDYPDDTDYLRAHSDRY